jgi:hypothetical protein
VRRLLLPVIALVCLSFGLVPLNTAHVHLDDHHESTVSHAGHLHAGVAGDQDLSGEDGEHIISTQLGIAANPAASPLLHWLPVFWVLVVIALGAPRLLGILRPPTNVLRPDSSRACKHPPLRGPPAVSI